MTDVVNIDLGGSTVRVRRLTLGEIREDRSLVASGDFALVDEAREKMIADHVTMADGSPLKTEDLSLPQMRKLMTALVGLPDEGGLSDFIGLLC